VLLAGLGVDSHQRVQGGERTRLATVEARRGRAADRRVVAHVDRLQGVEIAAQRRRQALIERFQVGEHGVAADRGHLHRAQEGERVRVGDEGDVDVPADRRAGLQIGAQRVVDIEIERGVLVPVASQDVFLDLWRLDQAVGDRVSRGDAAEVAREPDLLGVREVLIVEHQHLVFEQGLSDRRHGRLVELATKIDAADFRAGDGGDLAHGQVGRGAGGVFEGFGHLALQEDTQNHTELV